MTCETTGDVEILTKEWCFKPTIIEAEDSWLSESGDEDHPILGQMVELFENIGAEEALEILSTGEGSWIPIDFHERLSEESKMVFLSEKKYFVAEKSDDSSMILCFEAVQTEVDEGFAIYEIFHARLLSYEEGLIKRLAAEAGSRALAARISEVILDYSDLTAEDVLRAHDSALTVRLDAVALKEARELREYVSGKSEAGRSKPKI